METIDLIRALSQASGVTGYEHEAQQIVRDAFEPVADTLRSDALGNLIALKRGRGPDDGQRRSILLAAHTDEIGLIVTGTEKGFIRFTRVGGVDTRTILGQEVVVHGRRPLPGIIASRPPHVLSPEERNKAITLDKLFIDVGLTEERLKEVVQVGDIITMRRDLVELANGYVAGKAMDDRAGVVSLAVCLRHLQGLAHDWDVYAVATTQEEVGLKGATVAAYGVAPDIGVAIDVGFGKQKGVDEDDSIDMDGGPAILVGPNAHPLMHKRLADAARQYEIKHQFEYATGASGTDAWAIQVSRQGIPTGLLSIPLRYMHTTVETLCLRDVERTGRLLAFFIAGLDEAFAVGLGL